jgi:hypothetical protein
MAGRSEPDAERLLGVYATEMVSLHKRMLGAGYAKAFVDLDLLKVEMSRDAAGSSALRAWASRVWAAWLAQVLVGTKLCNGRVVRHVIPHHVIPYPSRDGDHVIHIP